MISAEIVFPSVVLQPYVHHYWILKTAGISMSNIILPEGTLHWMFHRKKSFAVDNVTQESIKASATGLYDKAIRISTTDDVELITVFFHPYAAGAVMGMSCKALAFDNIDFESLESHEFKELKRHVLDADTTEECIVMIEDFILKRLIKTQGSQNMRRLQKAFELMRAKPCIRISELASAACLSDRQFHRVFMDNVGMSPKQIQRVMRFRQATNQIIRTSPDSLDDVLYTNGYADHSHFNHEFHDIVGISPTEYIAALNEVRKRGVMPIYRSYHAPQ